MTIRNLWRLLLYAGLAYFIYLLLLITLQYIPIRTDVAFLRIKQEEIQLGYYRVAFFAHVFTSIVIISLGMTQFSTWFRRRYVGLHRIMGKWYVGLILLMSGPSGMIMSFHANGGLIAQVSFIILTALWMWTTWIALRSAQKGQYNRHRNFMIRSYALTLSAVSLRLFKFIIANTMELPPMDTYRIVAILGWTINLIVAELIIYRLNSKSERS